MDYQSLHAQTVVELRAMAKAAGVRVPAGTNKQRLIELLMDAEQRAAAQEKLKAKAEKPEAAPEKPRAQAETAAPRRRGRPPKAKPAQESKAPAAAVDKQAEAPEPAKREARPAVPAAKPAVESVKPAEPAAKPAAEPAKQTEPVVALPKPVEASTRPAEATTKQEPKPVERPKAGEASAQARTNVPNAGSRPDAAQRPGWGMRRTQNNPAQRPAGQRFVQNGRPANRDAAPPRAAEARPSNETASDQPQEQRPAEHRREGYYNAEYKTSNPAVPEMLAAGECGDGAGVLEIQPDGYGFLRAENCLPGPNDVYISIAQIRRFNLRMGDYVEGKTRPQREGDRYSAIMYITRVNGEPPEQAASRPRFEDLVPVYPDERLRLEQPGGSLSLRLVDMLAPIGKGQRGMIVSPPKAGKTTLLKQIANAITARYPDVHLIVLLIDERPEEVTDMQRSIQGEVIYSTFDEMPENHTRVSEMVLARAQRLVEMGRDVVVLMDSITRLARAYNLVIAPTGRSLSGGLDPGALFKPKRFFGAARNIENGGSLTIVATALVDTGSRMDDIIYEEFKGTGNMELHLDRRLSDRRVFPAIDMVRSGTRREELLLTEAELAGENQMRRMLGGGKDGDMPEQLIDLMTHTADNADFFNRIGGWAAVAEKEGFRRRE